MAKIVFVDREDRVIGAGSRKEAIAGGIIHRIIRVIVFNSQGEVLIQKRSSNVNNPDLWDQSVGGHVDEGETYEEAALREAKEEIGAQLDDLTEIEKYYLEQQDIDGSVVKRFNMLYSARYDGPTVADPKEVAQLRWVKPDELQTWMQERSDEFTSGFIDAFQRFLKRRS